MADIIDTIEKDKLLQLKQKAENYDKIQSSILLIKSKLDQLKGTAYTDITVEKWNLLCDVVLDFYAMSEFYREEVLPSIQLQSGK